MLQAVYSPYTHEADLKVLSHLVYEYEKGVRGLVLYTLGAHLVERAIDKLQRRDIDHLVLPVEGKHTVNIFFGRPECMAIVRAFLAQATLEHFSPEQDFILGTLLGYDLSGQCQRYCQRTSPCFIRKGNEWQMR